METNFIWKERKRNALGLPWTFTKYALTDDRLFITSGLLKTVEDEVRLYRIVDLSLSQTLSQKIFGIGTIQVSSADKSMRDFEIKNIKKPRDVKEQLSKLVEENRPELVIIDDLGALTGNAVSVSVVKKTMKGLNHIRESFELTMILVAHFRKRNGRNPIEISDIEGSSVICYYTDSIVAIGS